MNKPKSVVISTRVSQEFYDWLRAEAQRNERSMGQELIYLARQYYKLRDNPETAP